MADARERAYAAAAVLADALSLVGSPASIVEPEVIAGRATGRVRVVLREDAARALARRLTRRAGDTDAAA